LCWNYRVDSPKLGYDYGLRALSIYESQKNIQKQCNILNKLGINKRNTGEYSAALDNFYKILSIAEEPACSLEIAYANNNIADIYSRLEKYDKAIEFSNKALTFFKKVDSKTGIAYNDNLNGTIYQNIKDWNKALMFFRMSLDMRLKIKDISDAASSLINIGDCYRELNLPDSALTYYNKGIEYYKKAGFTNFGQSYIGLGKYYANKKNYQEAIRYLDEAISKGKLAKNPANIQKANDILHLIYFTLKDYKKAYEIQALARQEEDSLRKSDYINKITTLELNQAFEQQVRKKETEEFKKNTMYESHLYKQKFLLYSLIVLLMVISVITLLFYRNNKYIGKTNELLTQYNLKISQQKTAIENQNEQLRELNATKDKFFSIIAHDLKNPFSGILGISEHIISSWQKLTYEETVSLVRLINDSSQNAYDLLENLLEWSKAQTGRIIFNPEHFMFDHLLNEVIGLLQTFSDQKNITINFRIDENLNIFADQNMIHTVMRNLITNAIKFTEPHGKITVAAEHHGDIVKVTVSDTGVGISEINKEKLFSIGEKITSLGTRKEKGTGLGLLLCKEFIERHGGIIWVESELGKGSDIIFTLPNQTRLKQV
jgi:signal transduction histidine kinase